MEHSRTICSHAILKVPECSQLSLPQNAPGSHEGRQALAAHLAQVEHSELDSGTYFEAGESG